MKLVIRGKIQFTGIGRDMPVGSLVDVSRQFLDFAQETYEVSGKHLVFTDLRDHPEYSENSFLVYVSDFVFSKQRNKTRRQEG